MSNAITLLGEGTALPAHLAVLDGHDNIVARDTTPALSFKGKTWRLRIGGEETVLTRMNADNESEPTPIVKVVVLNINPARSRTFYAGAYEEGKNKSPDCWSSDGTRPDKEVTSPVAATCASCPNAVKGSRITENNKESTACTALKRIAVVPIARLDMEPLLLKIPQTSIWDKNNAENEAKGYFAWDQYVDFLRSRGLKHTAGVVTKIKFDVNVAYPKLLFTAERWLTPEELAVVAPIIESESVKKLLVGKLTEELVSSAPVAHATDDEDDGFGAAPAPAPAVKAKPAAAAKTKPAPVPEQPAASADEDDGFGSATTAPAATAAPAKAKPKAVPENVVAPVPTTSAAAADISALAAAWDDED